MAILEIIELPNPLLKKKSKPINKIDDDIKRLAMDMLETMYHAPGVGLAAPQVGVLKRLIVLDPYHEDSPDKAVVMINPEILEKSEETVVCPEGCLSVPEYQSEVERPEKIKVTWLDLEGKRHEVVSDDFFARVVQHEVDHLDGVLFIDRISRIKRNMVNKKLRKRQLDKEKDILENGDI